MGLRMGQLMIATYLMATHLGLPKRFLLF